MSWSFPSSMVWTQHILFLHLHIKGHIGCLQVLTVRNICAKVSCQYKFLPHLGKDQGRQLLVHTVNVDLVQQGSKEEKRKEREEGRERGNEEEKESDYAFLPSTNNDHMSLLPHILTLAFASVCYSFSGRMYLMLLFSSLLTCHTKHFICLFLAFVSFYR